MAAVDGIGLRERKRLATRRSLQIAVMTLAIDRGLDKVTVEEVSRAANVSPRTFFNYFPSKERAIAGEPLELPSPDELAEFMNSQAKSTLLGGLGHLLASSAERASQDVELHMLRRRVLKEHPQLLPIRMAAMRTYEDQLAEVVAKRLAKDDPELARRRAELERTAKLVTQVAFGVVRHAWTSWADSGGSISLMDELTDAFARLESILAPVHPK